jgi:hypothetical protein
MAEKERPVALLTPTGRVSEACTTAPRIPEPITKVKVRAIVARFRREDQLREFMAALDAVEDLGQQVYELVTELEDPDADLTPKKIHRVMDRVYGRLVGRIAPALKQLLEDGALDDRGAP